MLPLQGVPATLPLEAPRSGASTGPTGAGVFGAGDAARAAAWPSACRDARPSPGAVNCAERGCLAGSWVLASNSTAAAPGPAQSPHPHPHLQWVSHNQRWEQAGCPARDVATGSPLPVGLPSAFGGLHRPLCDWTGEPRVTAPGAWPRDLHSHEEGGPCCLCPRQSQAGGARVLGPWGGGRPGQRRPHPLACVGTGAARGGRA